MADSPLLVWHRSQGRMVPERVQDQRALALLYGTAAGRWAARTLFSSPLFSLLYGVSYRSARSRRKIAPFVRAYGIAAGEFEDRPYVSFNDFFARRFRGGARSFVAEPRLMPAFAEARYLAWEAAPAGLEFPVKGLRVRARALLAGRDRAARFEGGPLIVARLAPQDYHRVHFLDAGPVVEHYRIRGPLHSVNPLALAALPAILCTNRREVMLQDTESFGRIAYVEVGAMTVGRIVQHRVPGACPQRGDEKSHFEVGASTVVVLGEPGRWIPEADILENTRQGLETFVELGTVVARCLPQR